METLTHLCHHEARHEEDDTICILEDMDVKKGPWTDEEDALLAKYVQVNGEGRWNSVAHLAGLKRTGKSCRLRWLNYLRPDLRRGKITLEEQLTILQLHSRWGNRWSKIAKYLPGRTDNEIKNYWRTRVQKQAKQLKCDVNSSEFKETMRNVWIPQMVERIQTQASSGGSSTAGNFDPILKSPSSGSDSIADIRVSPDSNLCGVGEDGSAWNIEEMSRMWFDGGETSWDSWFWNEDDACFLQQQLYDVGPWEEQNLVA